MIRALHAVIAVRMDEPEEYKGQIYLHKAVREELETGTVVAAGPGETDNKGKFTENPVKEGDRILIAKGSGVKLDVNGEQLLFVTPTEITGIIRE